MAVVVEIAHGQRVQVALPRSLPAITPHATTATEITLDLNKTKILDTSDPTATKTAYLSSILAGIVKDGENQKLAISREAMMADSEHLEKPRPLTDVLKFGDEYLCIRTDVSFWDQASGEHEFDFQYDPEGENFGAGTAFLQD